jgi:hypothetical protein
MTQPEPMYFVFRRRPVKLLPGTVGPPVLWWLDLTTGAWVQEPDLVRGLAEAKFTDEPEPLTPDQFVDVVEAIRSRLTGEGDVHALYETASDIYAMAELEQRRLTPDEMAVLRGLRRQTYRMFEEDLARRGDPAAQPDLVPP